MRTFIFSICLFVQFSTNAQEISKSTSQEWAGGVYSTSGTNYIVVFDLPNSVSLEVDSVYLQNTGWVRSNLSHEYTEDKTRKVQLTFQTSRNERNDGYRDTIRLEPNIRVFEGQALIVMKVNGKRVEKIISSFEQLHFLAYP